MASNVPRMERDVPYKEDSTPRLVVALGEKSERSRIWGWVAILKKEKGRAFRRRPALTFRK